MGPVMAERRLAPLLPKSNYNPNTEMDPKNSGTPTTVIHHPTSVPQNSIPPPRGYALSGKIMLASIVVLFTIVLLILFVHLYVRWHVYRRGSRLRRRLRRRQRSQLVFASGELAAPSPAAPCGLDPNVLKSLPVVVFDLDEDEDDVAAECAVCLNEFEEGEKVRVLPRCDHRFHIECIDMWFGSHNSCPLCRSPVEIESPKTPAPPPAPQCDDLSGESSSDSSPSQDVSIQIRDGSSSEESASGAKSRILAFKRFWCADLRLERGERDLERGETAGRNAPPAPAAAAE